MKIAYFDCFSGISGDMVLGAFLDSGIELETLEKELKKLPLRNYQIKKEHVQKAGLWATKVHISSEEKGVVRTWANVRSLFKESKLPGAQKDKCLEIFLKIASAESKIHRREMDQVHFHEVGALDSILDIAGVVICLSLLKIDEVYASPLPTGMGFKKIDHGTIPIPAPATLEILKDVPIYSGGIPAELVTPTGAAIIKTYAKSFDVMPPLKPMSIGYGAGTQNLDIPNVLRIIIGESLSKDEYDEKSIIETNVDDLNPEFSSFIMEKLFDAGALDVWLAPIYMKKSRFGLKISVLAAKEKEEQMIQILFEETNTLGVRISKNMRRKVRRKEIRVKTEYGEAGVKIGFINDRVTTVSPEYDDCAALARNTGVPIKLVYEAARKEAEKKLTP